MGRRISNRNQEVIRTGIRVTGTEKRLEGDVPPEGWEALDQRTDRIQEEIIEVREMKNENLTVIKNSGILH